MKKIIIAFLIASIFFIGIFMGIILENFRQSDQKIFNFTSQNNRENNSEITTNIPVLSLYPIENGMLSGEISGDEVRINIISRSQKKSSTQVFPVGNFSFDMREILPMLKEVPHPKNTKFVASKRGKSFYAIDSPRAFLITAKNRTFFVTEDEAREKGYKKGK